jgi:hypothetical protein
MTAHKKTKKKRGKQEVKKPLWKRQDEKKREKKKSIQSKLVLWGITLFVFGLISLFVYRMFCSGSWEGRQRYNLLVGTPDGLHALVSISADEPDALIFVFDPNFLVEGVYGYGEYKIGSLLNLGKLEKLGDKLIKKSVQNTMGLRVQGYVSSEVPNDLDENPNTWLKKLIRPMSLSLIGNEIGILDVIRFSERISGLRKDQIEVMPLHESRLAVTVLQPDGTEVFQLDKLRLDGYLLNRIKGSVYTEEDHGVAVVNTTPHYGLATSVSRLFLNSGLDVVGVGENQMNLETTQILIKDEELANQETTRFATYAFDEYELKVGETDEYRAEVVVLIGEDYYRIMEEKPGR